MFIQVIKGPVSDPSRIKAALDRWDRELAAESIGWLGNTAGVTPDGLFIALARFASESEAQRNSERPEQDKWWSESASLFTEAPVFANSVAVQTDLADDPDTAGFVQIMQGRISDVDRAHELMQQDSELWREYRPDILGTVWAGHQGGAYTMAVYFTSEAEAREGERKKPPAQIREMMQEMDALTVGETSYYDIKEPWLYAPR